MYHKPTTPGEVLQGDLYRIELLHLDIASPRTPEGVTDVLDAVFNGKARVILAAVLSHSCDVADRPTDDLGNPRKMNNEPVVVAPLIVVNDYHRKLFDSQGGIGKLNDTVDPIFYEFFRYEPVEGAFSADMVAKLSEAFAVKWKVLKPSEKVAELTDEARLCLRLKLSLHFGRGDDAGHPMSNLIELGRMGGAAETPRAQRPAGG